MPWIQVYTPVGESLALSAFVASIPLIVIFVCLAVLQMKAHWAALLAVASAFLIAVIGWGMPAKPGALSFLNGVAFGLLPVFYIVIATIFLYNITVKGGQFEIIRASLAGLTADRRIQALLIAFCFGAFIEGAAGFGTPVAIAGATLVGLGFRPLYAAGVCLVANTAPVAFGAIGIPIVALAAVMGYNDDGMYLSKMVAHQLPFISIFIPFYVTVMICGLKRTWEVMPAVLVCGVTFALFQYLTAFYVGPYLPDITASLASLAALVILLRFWQPKENFVFAHEAAATKESHNYSGSQIIRAWTPYIFLTVMVMLWGIPAVKTALDKTGRVIIPIAGLDNQIAKNVSTPESGLEKIAVVQTEIDSLSASLPQDATFAPAKTLLGEIKTLETGMAAVEQQHAGQGAVLSEARYAAFQPLIAKNTELKTAVKNLEKANPEAAAQFAPLTKALNGQLPSLVAAKFNLNYLSAAGTAIIVAAMLSALVCGLSFASTLAVAKKTAFDMRFPALTIASVLGLAYLMNASGMTNCLGLAFTHTGHWFPLIAPILGWLGVFLTGSDTSSNVLFGGLQKATADNLGLNPVLTGAANTSGGVMGKMISPQSLAVATAATGMVGQEGSLFRFTLKHSIFLTAIICIMVYLQAYYLQWMIP